MTAAAAASLLGSFVRRLALYRPAPPGGSAVQVIQRWAVNLSIIAVLYLLQFRHIRALLRGDTTWEWLSPPITRS